MEATTARRSILKNRAKWKERLFLTCMLCIPVTHFFVFWVYVNFNSILLAFQDGLGDYNQFGNFKWFFKNITSDRPAVNIVEAIKNTLLLWGFNTFIELPISIIISYFFFKKISGYKAFRVILYLPAIISSVVMVTAFKNFIRSDGPLDSLVGLLNGGALPKLLYNSTYAMGTIIFFGIWTGYGIRLIFFTSAMERIPQEIFESAKLDGISPIKELTHIIMPLIWPVFTTILILAIASIFGTDAPILLFTKGEHGTMTVGYSIFQQIYFYDQINRAAAIGLFFTGIGIVFVLLSRWLLSKLDTQSEY